MNRHKINRRNGAPHAPTSLPCSPNFRRRDQAEKVKQIANAQQNIPDQKTMPAATKETTQNPTIEEKTVRKDQNVELFTGLLLAFT